MKPERSIRGVLKRKSLFYRILGLMMALSIITIIIFTVFINHLVVRNQKKNIDELNLLQLQRIGSDVELVFDLLAENILSNMGSRDFVSIMITPDVHDVDVAYRVINVLENLVEDNNLIRKAYLYLPLSEEVYVYSGTYMALEHLGDRELIYQYMNARSESRDPEVLSQWEIILFNRRIFLVADYCIPNFLGAIFFEINRTELYDIIQTEHQRFDTTIYVYDQQGNLLFDYMAGGLQQSDFQDESLFMSIENSNANASYYYYASPVLGWKFLTRINAGNGELNISALILLLLPVLVIYILVSQIFSLYITQTIYRPIHRLLQIAAKTETDGQTSIELERRKIQTEVDYLEYAFIDSMEKNEQHQRLMSHISDDVMEQLMRGILSGRNVAPDHIQKTLEGIHQQQLARGRCMVLASMLLYPEQTEPDMIEHGLFQRSVLQIFRDTEEEGYRTIAFFTERDLAVCILLFSGESSLLQIKSQANKLQMCVLAQIEALPFRLVIGSGRVYEDISSLQFSYHEAVDNVRYSRYLNGSAAQMDTTATKAENYEAHYYVERLRQIIATPNAESAERKEAAIESLIDEMYARVAMGPQLLNRLTDEVTELLISARVTQEEMLLVGIPKTLDRLLKETNAEKQQESLRAFYRGALRLQEISNKRIHNKRVLDAKEYVASHYMDGDLSLSKIGEAIGLSVSYLSGIFPEATGEKFSSYLNNYRIEQAKRFLMETSLNVSEIGYKCGFNSAQSFGRVFKARTGLTPKQYRERSSGADRR